MPIVGNGATAAVIAGAIIVTGAIISDATTGGSTREVMPTWVGAIADIAPIASTTTHSSRITVGVVSVFHPTIEPHVYSTSSPVVGLLR